MYARTVADLSRVASAADDNYPHEDGLGITSIRDIVEQRTSGVHKRAGAGSICALGGYGASSRLPDFIATLMIQERRDYQHLRVNFGSPPPWGIATSRRVFCTIRSAGTAVNVKNSPIQAAKSASPTGRSHSSFARSGRFGYAKRSLPGVGSEGGEVYLPPLHCFTRTVVLPILLDGPFFWPRL